MEPPESKRFWRRNERQRNRVERMQGERKLTNREKIFYTAIDLFSERGFAGVSLRELASAVGIKAASIYNHYSNKEAILEEIAIIFRNKLLETVSPVFQTAKAEDISSFICQVTKANDAFFADAMNAKMGWIVLREQFLNEAVRAILLDVLIRRPREGIAANFSLLMQSGKMRTADPVFAAIEYHAFYIYEFYENALARENSRPAEQAMREQSEHIRLFIEDWTPKDTIKR